MGTVTEHLSVIGPLFASFCTWLWMVTPRFRRRARVAVRGAARVVHMRVGSWHFTCYYGRGEVSVTAGGKVILQFRSSKQVR